MSIIATNTWPWGRTSPGQRIIDLQRMIRRNHSQIPIVEDQAKEAIRRININNDALKEQLRVAEECEQEEVRGENKKIAYQLSSLGINMITEVDEANDQVELQKTLQALLEESKNTSNKNVEDIESFLNSMDT